MYNGQQRWNTGSSSDPYGGPPRPGGYPQQKPGVGAGQGPGMRPQTQPGAFHLGGPRPPLQQYATPAGFEGGPTQQHQQSQNVQGGWYQQPQPQQRSVQSNPVEAQYEARTDHATQVRR